MTGFENVNSAAGAFVAGLVTSVHCVGMCGPLACALGALPGGAAQRQQAAALYQVGRLISYATVGAACGWGGSRVLGWVADGPAVLLPWFLALALLAFGLGLERRLPRPAFLARWTGAARVRLCRLSAPRGGLGLGLVTPLLPCGPLYLMFGIALVSGSAARGAEMMLAFAMGTLPLLWLGQHQFFRLQARLGAGTLSGLRRGTALLAAGVMLWRLRDTLWFAGNGLPSCCH